MQVCDLRIYPIPPSWNSVTIYVDDIIVLHMCILGWLLSSILCTDSKTSVIYRYLTVVYCIRRIFAPKELGQGLNWIASIFTFCQMGLWDQMSFRFESKCILCKIIHFGKLSAYWSLCSATGMLHGSYLSSTHAPIWYFRNGYLNDEICHTQI